MAVVLVNLRCVVPQSAAVQKGIDQRDCHSFVGAMIGVPATEGADDSACQPELLHDQIPNHTSTFDVTLGFKRLVQGRVVDQLSGRLSRIM